jgi:hypothetical protein
MTSLNYLRNLVWYERFLHVVKAIEGKEDIEDILTTVFSIIDEAYGFRTQTISDSAFKQLGCLLNDCGYTGW